MTDQRDRKSGVALLELLLALAVMSLLAVAVASVLGTMVRTSDRSTRVDDALAVALVEERLRDLAATSPPSLAIDGAPVWTGTQSALTFFTIDESGSFWSGKPVRVSLSVTETGLLAKMEGAVSQSRPGSEQTLLRTGSGTTKLSYFGLRNGVRDWGPDWTSASAAPLLIKIEWRSQSGRWAPPLILEPGIVFRQRIRSLSSLVPPG